MSTMLQPEHQNYRFATPQAIQAPTDDKVAELMEKAGFGGAKGKPKFMQPTASAMEAGLTKARAAKSPDQSKAKAEEAKLKKVSPQK